MTLAILIFVCLALMFINFFLKVILVDGAIAFCCVAIILQPALNTWLQWAFILILAFYIVKTLVGIYTFAQK